MYTVHFMAGERKIDETVRSVIEGVSSAVYERVSQVLDLDECDILLVVNPKRVIAGEIFREFLNDDSSCYVFADGEALESAMGDDPNRVMENFAEHLYAGLYSTARIRHTGTGADCGLLEEVVNEGLAGHFVSEMGNGAVKGYYIALSPKECGRHRERMLWECNEKHCDIEKWFRGSDADGIPPLAALSLGFFIAAEYLERIGKSSVEVLRTAAPEFVRQ